MWHMHGLPSCLKVHIKGHEAVGPCWRDTFPRGYCKPVLLKTAVCCGDRNILYEVQLVWIRVTWLKQAQSDLQSQCCIMWIVRANCLLYDIEMNQYPLGAPACLLYLRTVHVPPACTDERASSRVFVPASCLLMCADLKLRRACLFFSFLTKQKTAPFRK